MLGRANVAERAALKTYGDHLGFAFQISDDLLDATGTIEMVGKAVAKDAALADNVESVLNGRRHGHGTRDRERATRRSR